MSGFPIIIKGKNNYGVVKAINQNFLKEPLNVQQANVEVHTFGMLFAQICIFKDNFPFILFGCKKHINIHSFDLVEQ